MKKIGEDFLYALNKAGLSGLPFSWGDNGELFFSSGMKKTDIDKVKNCYGNYVNNSDTYLQIKNLESLITSRRIREAILGIDDGWLSDIEGQINILREQIK